MGRKSKSRGKSKRGDKQRPSPPAKLGLGLNAMEILERGNTLLQGGNNAKRALEGRQLRDQMEEAMKTADPEKYDDFLKKELGEEGVAMIPALSQMMMAMTTLTMAKCGVVEEGKHSSISYVEEHADVLFKDGGEKFFTELKEATDKAALEQKRRNDMEKMINDGDTDGQRRMLQDLMSTMEKKYEDMRIAEGMPPIPEDERVNFCHNTNLDEELFQPCPPRQDCPICFLPFPGRAASTYQPCCGKLVCDGCVYSHRVATLDSGTEFCCPFCRDPTGDVNSCIKKSEKRMKYGDCEAYYTLGARYLEGTPPLKQDTKKGLELMNQAAELGSEAAHHSLGAAYAYGTKYLKHDKQKGLYHLRLAAIGGMLESRHLLGQWTQEVDPPIAYKHFIIAAEAGHDESLKEVKTGYTEGHVEKDAFENVLRAHQAAKDSVKSEARDKAAKDYYRA